MKTRVKLSGLAAGLVAFAALCLPAQAALVTVAYNGSYNEATEAPSGDYDAIGGAADVGVFDLIGSTSGTANTFSGSIVSPNDSSDFFSIRLAAGQTLTSASITFGQNLSLSEYMFAFPAPHWVMEYTNSVTPTIFDQELGYDYMWQAETYTPTFTAIGEGVYNILIGNGTFGRNGNTPITYEMTFNVTSPPVSAVPLPAALPLYGAGLAVMGFLGWRRKRKQA
ncbi:MAG: VPLPA-CTERM sorting domain-containing protein [Sneathiella sp.]